MRIGRDGQFVFDVTIGGSRHGGGLKIMSLPLAANVFPSSARATAKPPCRDR